MSTIYGYVRVSHEDSTLSGLSPEAQRLAILRYVEVLDGTMSDQHYPDHDTTPGIFTDYSQSAWKCKFNLRPAGRQIQSLVQPGDHVVIMSIDRGFRDTADFISTVDNWTKRGINVHFIQEQFNLASANGRLLGSIIASLAEWQSHVKSERQKDAASAKRDNAIVKKPPSRIATWKDSDVIIPRLADVKSEAPTGTIYTYGRKSRVEQEKDRSLEAQKQITDRHAQYIARAREGLVVGPHFEDSHVSAYSKDFRNRPAGKELDALLKAGDVVVVTRLDRAWRRLLDMLNTLKDWTERGVVVHFCDMMLDTSSVMGKFFLQIMAIFAELESSMKSASTKAANAAARARGRVQGQIPRGVKKVRHTVGNRTYIMAAWDVLKLREMRIAHYLRTKRKWSVRDTARWLECVAAKREGRDPIPIWGRKVKHKDRYKYPRWTLSSVHEVAHTYEIKHKPLVDKMLEERRKRSRRQSKASGKKAEVVS